MKHFYSAFVATVGLAACDDDTGTDHAGTDHAGTADTDTNGEGADPKSCDENNGSITLPAGFCAAIFADGVERARHMVVTPSGDVYVATNDSMDGKVLGNVVALRDDDDDGHADVMEHFGDKGGNGIAWHDGKLYFGQNDRILRYTIPEGALVPEHQPDVVVSGLPATGDHVSKTIVVSENGELFVNIGSASNACQMENRVPLSPGIDPCVELETRAGVWRFDANGTDQTQHDGVRFAMGVRNAVALAIHPESHELVAVQNGRDQLHENWPELFTPNDDQRLPSEELFILMENADYGWPYCYHDADMNEKVLAPEYGGDGQIIDRCAHVEEPDVAYPAHWAPLGVHFYGGDQFPDHYRNGAFIAFHGSRFAPDAMGELPGYNVVFQPFTAAAASNTYEVFATDFAGNARPLPEQAKHRPVGLAERPDGSLYISDDHGGRIWRVFYRLA